MNEKSLLDAGAVLLLDTAENQDDVDGLTARTYTHPALDDRVVVRLVPQTLGDAEDLSSGFLGLERTLEPADVGRVRRESLGFPAWALVNDPANGHHALALVQDIERLDRQAKNKPGHAKDGFDALGLRLGRAVPHFLPTFYEQAARILLAHDNTTYAAMFFGKAREAERVHSLPVDEDRLRAVFLEFAFAGALTVKALKEYAKDLTRRVGAAEAWAQFRRLCAERCIAGMPPYAGLAEDARSMIKASGLDKKAQEAEEHAFLREMLDSPAVARAPLTFWKAALKPLTAMAAADDTVKVRLLAIIPKPPGYGTYNADDELWLSVLADTGADTLLTGPATDTFPAGAPAAWLARWATHRNRGWHWGGRHQATLTLVGTMTGRLTADDTPVQLFGPQGRAYGDLDIADTLLAAGVPLTEPDGGGFDLDGWIQDNKAEEARRDLVATAADERFLPRLRRAVSNFNVRNNATGTIGRAAGHPVLRGVLTAWLDEQVTALERAGGMPAADGLFNTIGPFAAACADIAPETAARVRDLPVAPLLARTLRAGVFDELGWHALEEAVATLGAPLTAWFEAWPAVILITAEKAVVVGPEGVLLEHTLRIPPTTTRQQRSPEFSFVDGELLVAWWGDDPAANQKQAYWSNRPDEVFALSGTDNLGGAYGSDRKVSLPLPGGGRTTGGRPVHAGDTSWPKEERVLTDGVSYWTLETRTQQPHWVEFDPATGARGRVSLPRFLADAVAVTNGTAGSLLPAGCDLMPLHPGLEGTPFGTDGHFLGRWTRQDGETRTAGSPDGRTVSLPARLLKSHDKWRPDAVLVGALTLPGGAAPTLTAGNYGAYSLWDGETLTAHIGSQGAYRAGTDHLPHHNFWHAMRPRDEAGSLVLRATTDEQAAAMIAEATRIQREAVEAAKNLPADSERRPELHPLPRTAVPAGITHEGLARGVAGIIRVARQLTDKLAQFAVVKAAADSPAAAPAAAVPGDGVPNAHDRKIRSAVRGLSFLQGFSTGYSAAQERWTVLPQILAVNALLSDTLPNDTTLNDDQEHPAEWKNVPGVQVLGYETAWPELLGIQGPMALRAALPGCFGEDRDALLALLEALGTGPLADPGGTVRTVVVHEPRLKYQRTGQVLRNGDRTLIILRSFHDGPARTHQKSDTDWWQALDHDPTGGFAEIPFLTVHSERRITGTTDPDTVRELVRLTRANGPAPVRPGAAESFSEATGLTLTESALLLAGLPAPAGYNDTGGDFGGDLVRAETKCNVADVDAARILLGRRKPAAHAALTALLPADPEHLWTAGPDTAAAAAAWTAHHPRLLRLPEDVARDLTAVSGSYHAKIGVGSADAVLNPAAEPWITDTATRKPDSEQALKELSSGLPEALESTVATLVWLAYRLPHGDPQRAVLTDALARLRTRLADPGLWLCAGSAPDRWKALRVTAGLPEEGGADKDGLTRVNEALTLVPGRWQDELFFRPAAFTGPDDLELARLRTLARGKTLNTVHTLLGGTLDGLLAEGGFTGYAQDPQLSVPELVAEVAKTHGLSADAAALYLQLLALPDPSDRNVARWTTWKPARIKKARAELTATDLVVEAKRARAGRSLFLPGGWHAHKTPAPPVETWKDGLYVVLSGTALLVHDAPAELFRTAWRRVADGDAPGLEELKTTPRRGRK